MAGLYFDDLSIGQVFRHEIRRTITEAQGTVALYTAFIASTP